MEDKYDQASIEAYMDGVTPKLFDTERIMYGVISVNRRDIDEDGEEVGLIAERYLFLCTDLKVMFPNLRN